MTDGINSALQTSVQGLLQAQRGTARAAQDIVEATTVNVQPAGNAAPTGALTGTRPTAPGLIEGIVDLKLNEVQFEASAAAYRAAAEMDPSKLLDDA